MENQAFVLPRKPVPRTVQHVSRLVVLSLRLLDLLVMLVFAGAIIYLLGTVLP